ncbi:MAG: 30S ribosomal protein S12 methylthiotransferase RimO, partial [Vicinamibacteria bacterium]|nr:30S ribosomal protein S12 methylthiotransferase RimO [Vicinamibacteria bacterium]
RRILPDAAIRSAFIVGFPGESERDFQELAAFMRQAAFDHVGVFAYSHEQGTDSFRLRGRVDPQVAEGRRRSLMSMQKKLARRRNQSRVGQRVDVLIETTDGSRAVGRIAIQAPDIDGRAITLRRPRSVRPGQFLSGRILAADAYDYFIRLAGR